MPKYEIAIAVKDEADNALGKYRKKEGDIITVRPHPWNWGRKEIDEYLIVIIECGIGFPELKLRLKTKMYAGGHQRYVTFRDIGPPEENDLYPTDKYVISLPDLKYMLRPAYIGKRKYRIPLTKLGLISIPKVQDKNYIYQPFKSATQLIEAFDGKNGRYLLEKTDVDCVATSIGEDQEVSVIWDSTVKLIQNKTDNSYIKP